MAAKVYMTQKGLNALLQKSKDLEKELRRLQASTADAAEVGGNQYHDNASYEYLVIQIRAADRRLAETLALLNSAVVVEPPQNPQTVQFGTSVEVDRDGSFETWHIVGEGEGNWSAKKIAYGAPLAQLIIGAMPGEKRMGIVGGRNTQIQVISISTLRTGA